MSKIPTAAKKVFEGKVFSVYQWDQELFDGTTGIFEAVKKKDSVTVIAVVGDKIIINEEEQPSKPAFHALPGGVADMEGGPLENAKRELVEETGYTSNDWQEWFVSDPIDSSRIEWNNYIFIARNCIKTNEQNLDAGEKIKPTLVSFEEFLEFRNNPKARNKDLFKILEKASQDELEKETLKTLLGLSTTN